MTLREWSDWYEGGVNILSIRGGWPPEALVDREGWFGPQWIRLYGVELGYIEMSRLAEKEMRDEL